MYVLWPVCDITVPGPPSTSSNKRGLATSFHRFGMRYGGESSAGSAAITYWEAAGLVVMQTIVVYSSSSSRRASAEGMVLARQAVTRRHRREVVKGSVATLPRGLAFPTFCAWLQKVRDDNVVVCILPRSFRFSPFGSTDRHLFFVSAKKRRE